MKRITTLTGPSCAGKSTLEAALAAGGALRAISTTTRPPRAGEVDGVHYYFVSYARFELMVADDKLAEMVSLGGNLYGLTTAELDRLFAQGDHVVVVCEPHGAKQIRKYCNEKTDVSLVQVFVNNPQSVIFSRFLERFCQDYDEAKALGTRTATARVKEVYSKRAVIMAGIERDWVQEAYGPAYPESDHLGFRYNILLDRFDAENIEQITADLLR